MGGNPPMVLPQMFPNPPNMGFGLQLFALAAPHFFYARRARA
jgi:hypothetical protein